MSLFNQQNQLSIAELERLEQLQQQQQVQAVASAYAGVNLVPCADGVLSQPQQQDAAEIVSVLQAGGINVGGVFSGCRLARSTPYNGVGAVGTYGTFIPFDLPVFDTSGYQTSPTDITIPVTGYYDVYAVCFIGSSHSNNPCMAIVKNFDNTTVTGTFLASVGTDAAGTVRVRQTARAIVRLTAGDVIRMMVSAAGGGTPNTFTVSGGSAVFGPVALLLGSNEDTPVLSVTRLGT